MFESHHQLQKPRMPCIRGFYLFTLRFLLITKRNRASARFVICPMGNVASGRVFESHHQLQKPRMLWRCVPKDTTPTLFACGELYCFAVIFVLRRVIFASRVYRANRISLQDNVLKYHFCDSKNITLSKTAYHEKLSGSAHLLTTECGGAIKNSRYGFYSISAISLSFRTRRICVRGFYLFTLHFSRSEIARAQPEGTICCQRQSEF